MEDAAFWILYTSKEMELPSPFMLNREWGEHHVQHHCMGGLARVHLGVDRRALPGLHEAGLDPLILMEANAVDLTYF